MIQAGKLALLIPAYNAVHYLPRLLSSAAQDGGFDEIWVYDDCSTDETAELAERLGAQVVRGDVNRGCTWGKSILAARTSCEWIHFHDADDLLLPGFVSAARSWINADNADVVVFGCEERWDDTRGLISVNTPNDAALSQDAVTYTLGHKINAISGLYRTAAFLAVGFDLDPEVLYNEDEACHCGLARAGLRFRADPRPLVLNLRQRSSMSVSNQDRCLRSRFCVLKKALRFAQSEEQRVLIFAGLWRVAAGAAANLDWRTADAAAKLAIKLNNAPDPQGGALFSTLCRLSPRLALRARECLIRLFRPALRSGFPARKSALPGGDLR